MLCVCTILLVSLAELEQLRRGLAIQKFISLMQSFPQLIRKAFQPPECKVTSDYLQELFAAEFSPRGSNQWEIISPGKGIPNRLSRSNNQTQPLSCTQIPTPEEAEDHLHRAGGQLTLYSPFGADPLHGRDRLASERETLLLTSVVPYLLIELYSEICP